VVDILRRLMMKLLTREMPVLLVAAIDDGSMSWHVLR
jgi:hypothetical protein